ncbi:MAG: elongation factor 1-beta [Nanoarchaeota archaeon]|nr:elongation factor 1-beta [Nanoarchaeota archaeon]
MAQTAMMVLKIMPESVEVDLNELKEKVNESIIEIYGDVGEIQTEEEPIAFGLKALKFTFIMDESKGGDAIETKLADVEGIASANVIDFRRTFG